MTDPLSTTAAVIVFLGSTASMLGLTLVWSMANRHPVRAHAQLTGRRAVPSGTARPGVRRSAA
jgi:hypothetical protein